MSGCTSDSSSELLFDTTVATTPATPTSLPIVVEPTTTTQAQRAAPITTVPATTTTVEPTTTTESIDTIKAKVEAAYRASLDARAECNFDPVGCNYEIIAAPDSPLDMFDRALMATRIEANLRAVEGKGEFRYDIEEVEVEGDIAFVTVCAFDSIVIYDVGDPSDPADDIVFDDTTPSNRVRWMLRRSDDVWRVYEGIELAAVEGDSLCGR